MRYTRDEMFYDRNTEEYVRGDDLIEHIYNEIDGFDEIFDVMLDHFSLDYIWEHLDDSFKDEAFQVTYDRYLKRNIEEVEENEE